MARRRIGQERLAVGGLAPRGSRSLDVSLALYANAVSFDQLLALGTV